MTEPKAEKQDRKTKARAVVSLQVEVHLDQPWSEDATVKQIHATASREAKEKLDALLRVHERTVGIVGEPVVRTVIVGEAR